MAGGENLGPLTTTAALASSCAGELDKVYKVNTTPDGYYYLLNGPVDVGSCYPSSYAGVTTQYYSPAPACPAGFTPACASINAVGTVSETAYTCCPTEYDYSCQTTASYDWESTLGCVMPVDSSSTTIWTVTEISSGSTSTVTSTGYYGGMNAYSIQVRFQATDLAAATTSQTSSIPAVTVTSSNAASSTSTAGSTSSSGLSTGTIAGVAVGAAVVVLGIIGAAAFLMIRKRKQQRQVVQNNQPPPTAELENPNDPNKQAPPYYYTHELGPSERHEVYEAPA
ncbi:hypothetical protein BJ166DRAFT_35321 [Pestalotiopsis sp. NC0098]|nr:hypothetical protein BJ166DRAFT_35321 [Pestalotiopsis sp. NC0098]